jgi:hypothetical protein
LDKIIKAENVRYIAHSESEVEKALENVKEGMRTLADYCENTGCHACVMNNPLCSALSFELTIEAIEEWQRTIRGGRQTYASNIYA